MNTDLDSNKKIVVINENTIEKSSIKKIVREKKEQKIRVETQKWTLDSNEYCNLDNQLKLIKTIQENNYTGNDYNSCLILKQIERKISGYRHQDVLKNILDGHKLIKMPEVVDSLITSELKCYYCKANMYLLYDIVRETQQWTVDRIDNDLGHNSDNFVLACLGCNLKRRCRTKDKFLFTKQLVIKKVHL